MPISATLVLTAVLVTVSEDAPRCMKDVVTKRKRSGRVLIEYSTATERSLVVLIGATSCMAGKGRMEMSRVST